MTNNVTFGIPYLEEASIDKYFKNIKEELVKFMSEELINALNTRDNNSEVFTSGEAHRATEKMLDGLLKDRLLYHEISLKLLKC